MLWDQQRINMSPSFEFFACLLLYLPFTQAALTVTVPEGPIQAKPGSDVLLPCYFEESSGHIDPKRLAVIWSVGTRDIAKYEDKLEVFHPGAKMSSEGLLRGNASILLPNVQDADGTTYTCFVIHSPDSEKKSVVLRVEAAPLVKLGSTTVQLTKPSMVACIATDFYPGNISMTWFRNDRIVQGPEWPPAQPSTGQLFRAESLLKLTPEFSDANANYSCQIHHQASKGPEVLKFQLHLQARPILQLTTMPQGETFVVAVCNLSKFYPSQINVQWLQSGVPQEQIKSEVHRMHNGMFSINSVFLPQKNNVKVTYVCRVEHEGLETPLEQSVHWQPEVTPSIPSIPVIPWPLGVILALVCGFILGAGIVSCICKAKNNSVTQMSSEKMSLQKMDKEKSADVSKPNMGEDGSGVISTEELEDVQVEQPLSKDKEKSAEVSEPKIGEDRSGVISTEESERPLLKIDNEKSADVSKPNMGEDRSGVISTEELEDVQVEQPLSKDKEKSAEVSEPKIGEDRSGVISTEESERPLLKIDNEKSAEVSKPNMGEDRSGVISTEELEDVQVEQPLSKDKEKSAEVSKPNLGEDRSGVISTEESERPLLKIDNEKSAEVSKPNMGEDRSGVISTEESESEQEKRPLLKIDNKKSAEVSKPNMGEDRSGVISTEESESEQEKRPLLKIDNKKSAEVSKPNLGEDRSGVISTEESERPLLKIDNEKSAEVSKPNMGEDRSGVISTEESERPLLKIDNEKSAEVSKPNMGEDRSGVISTEESEGVQEQRL